MIGTVDTINRYLSNKTKYSSISRKHLREYCTKHIIDYFVNSNNGKTVIKGSSITPEIIFSYFKLLKKENKPTLQMLKDIEEKYPNLDESKICFSIIYCFSKVK